MLFSMANFLRQYGYGEEKFKKALMEHYNNEQSVKQIVVIAKLYEQFETIDIDQHTFPLVRGTDYSYRGTWGASRGWGGRRIHEGTDIFAPYGTPVVSTSYGVIEVMGWNDFGGWRIGIRDNHNSYHYYAHLAYFEKGLSEGDIVKAGQVIGYVGNTGYGKEGTAGKFPPHLHYGIYKFNGRTEWAFDPYPALTKWEKQRQIVAEQRLKEAKKKEEEERLSLLPGIENRLSVLGYSGDTEEAYNQFCKDYQFKNTDDYKKRLSSLDDQIQRNKNFDSNMSYNKENWNDWTVESMTVAAH